MATSNTDRTYDCVVFGATGFTGQKIAARLLERATASAAAGGTSAPIKRIAIAGRRQAALEAVKTELSVAFPTAGPAVGILCADSQDYASIQALVKSSRVLINAVGPFRLHGEPVVRACAEAGTHYVDITGEPEFVERMILQHDAAARRSGAVIVHTCGFDSIPSDVGIRWLMGACKAREPTAVLHSVDGFLRVQNAAPNRGLRAHSTTWETAVRSVSNISGLRALRKELAAQPTRTLAPARLGDRPRRYSMMPRWEPRESARVVPFVFADSAVVRNSQVQIANMSVDQLAAAPDAAAVDAAVPTSDVQPYFSPFIVFPSLGGVIKTVLASMIVGCFAWASYGRKLLIRFPRFFTWGVFSHEGPTEQDMAATTFSWTLRGSGALASNGAKFSVHAEVAGPEPGYVATSRMVVAAAECILGDVAPEPVPAQGAGAKRNKSGGVFTPQAAFLDTRIVDRLREGGLAFELHSFEASPAP